MNVTFQVSELAGNIEPHHVIGVWILGQSWLPEPYLKGNLYKENEKCIIQYALYMHNTNPKIILNIMSSGET